MDIIVIVELVKKMLTGWGGSLSASCFVADGTDLRSCYDIVEYARNNHLTICNRGHGCSHADAILNTDHIVLCTLHFNNIRFWNKQTGIMRVEPGVTFSKALQMAIVDGWVVPCAPGGLDVTMAGAAAFDVHGKDGVRNGSFGDHVRRIQLLTSDGSVLEITKSSDPALFNATIGGMGLTGVITELELQLVKINSSMLVTTNVSTNSVHDSLVILDQEEEMEYDYAIGWLDTFAPSRSVGRGFMTYARWSNDPVDLSNIDIATLFATQTKFFGFIDSHLFWRIAKSTFRPSIVRWVNLAHWLLAKALYGKGFERERFFSSYLYIHNMIPSVNFAYHPDGLVTCQPLLPRSAGHDAVMELLQICQKQGVASMMAGIKRRQANDRILSFALDGYSFSIDIHRSRFDENELKKRLTPIYEFIIKHEGLVYLAKDDRLPEIYFKKMYPQYKKFWNIKEKVDPNHLFMSDQARRIFGISRDI